MCFAVTNKNKKNWRWAPFILGLFLASSVCSQEAVSLKPSIDLAQFQDKTHQTYLEIYYAIPDAAIKYVPASNSKEEACQLLLSLQVYRDRTLWASKVWKIEKSRPATLPPEPAAAQQLVDIVSYLLDGHGQYRITLHVKDLQQAGRLDSASAEITVRDFKPEKVELSDVELASSIKPSSAATVKIFNKQQQEIIPNPTAVFGEQASYLYYYFEAYHLIKNVVGEKYKTFAHIQNTDNEIDGNLGKPMRTKKKVFDASAEMGQIDLGALPSGKYRLFYGLADSAATVLASRHKEFYIYNPARTLASPPIVAAANMSGPLQGLNEKELNEEFAQMFFLTSKDDRNFYKNLSTAHAKREFIASLWQNASAEAALTSGAFRQQFLTRAAEANTRYKSPLRPGWKTDRGRVFMLYGPANQIERFPSGTTSLPYEIWTYDNLKGQGGVTFIFADRTGFNNYEQIHATLQGELQEPDWQRLIARGSSGENMNINNVQP